MKRSVLLVGILVLGLAALGWAREDRMKSGPETPAAEGVVKTEPDSNGNVRMEVKVEHLAPPSRLSPARQTYVVWVKAPGKDAENLGQLRVNEDLEGRFVATTTYKKFDVFVTAEDNPTANSPSGTEVLRTTVERE